MTGEVSNGGMFARARRDGENVTADASQTQVEPGVPDIVIDNTADNTDGSDVQEPTADENSVVVVGATAWILTILFSL